MGKCGRRAGRSGAGSSRVRFDRLIEHDGPGDRAPGEHNELRAAILANPEQVINELLAGSDALRQAWPVADRLTLARPPQ